MITRSESSIRVGSTYELAAKMDAAALVARGLEDVGLSLSLDAAPGGRVRIELRSASGEPLRELSYAELFGLFDLAPSELDAWAARAVHDTSFA
ncbi:hypothetical protein [Conexibacter sp. CPCC 206217]|uniref:hypothetical protein n=1 Tax=Conexibacter sp. CPCC 206217 TaxID=3064574 RepID=UPI00271F667D|nr:hypothetical protein [Conexibacter sp. CPCC 206217]MDO8212376.1 hypothetical protein [Conexibacter sp. CPCC 206217]